MESFGGNERAQCVLDISYEKSQRKNMRRIKMGGKRKENNPKIYFPSEKRKENENNGKKHFPRPPRGNG
jgi:hypothetical protein